MCKGIVGAKVTYPITIDNKDLHQFLHLECLDIQMLQLAILAFQNICSQDKRSASYGFLCPANTTKNRNKLEERSIYVGCTFAETKLPCYLAPIYEDNHWTLCVVCPSKNVCYWFDSLKGKPNGDIKHIFSTAIKTSKIFAGKKEGLAKEPKWFYPKCPRQLGQTECGYYVILYMFYIIQSGCTIDFEQFFNTEAAYSEEDIDLGRDPLAGYLLSHVDI